MERAHETPTRTPHHFSCSGHSDVGFASGVDLLKGFLVPIIKISAGSLAINLLSCLPMPKLMFLLFAACGLFAGCSTSQRAASLPLFKDDGSANIIIRYYSDSTSTMLKPEKHEGNFNTLLTINDVMEIARQVPGRDLAVVVLNTFHTKADEQVMMRRWQDSLAALGYHHTVFLRGNRNQGVNGLPVLPGPLPPGNPNAGAAAGS